MILKRKKNVTVNKKRTTITSRCNSMLHLQKKIHKNIAKDNNHEKVRDHCYYTGKYRGAAHNICNLRFNVTNEITVVFQNWSKYDYHNIIKELGNEFEGKFECLGENTEKYNTFSVPIEKEIRKVDEDGNEDIIIISDKI